MRYFFIALFVASLLLAQEKAGTAKVAASRPVPPTAPQKRHPDGRPLGVPLSAVKIAEGAWRSLENGTPVIYRATAFGYSKVSEEENARIQRMINGKPDGKQDAPEGIIAIDEGKQFRFKRETPFGPVEWTKAKSELNTMEKAIVAKSKGTEQK
jgi:hypothetical protein